MNISDIAQHYTTAPAYELPSHILKNFRQFIIDLAQVELRDTNFQYVDFQPYFREPEICLEDIHADFNQGTILISAQFNESHLLGPEINLILRCIHEMHHIKLNVDFSWQGECATARHIIALTDNLLFQQILFSEFLGQSAVCLQTGQFPDHQKVVLFEPDVLRCLAKGWLLSLANFKLLGWERDLDNKRLRESILTLPVMMAVILSLVYRQIARLSESVFV